MRMTFLVSFTFLLLNCLLSCSADFNSTLMEYRKAYYDSQAMQYHVFQIRAAYSENFDVEMLLRESQRLDRLYQLKWINELISSPVFSASQKIDSATKRRYANEYEKEKRLNQSTPLGTESDKLIEALEKKWKARARLDAAEDARLKSSKSLAKCVKRKENTPEKVNLASGEKQILELKKAAIKGLYELIEVFKKYILNYDDELTDSLETDTLLAEVKYGREIDALVNKIVDVERQRLQYLQLLCPDERVKVVIDSVIAEVYTPTK
uniref:Uncharacterized protein n=1 Tax=Trichobilharzia regenti TaxID=157069 RepID=A0AA85KCU3_TRIRE|nr:unnamed protein product [Trichobilharzia regenti]